MLLTEIEKKLYHSIVNKDLKGVRQAVQDAAEDAADIINSDFEDYGGHYNREGPLHIAAEKSSPEIIEFLIDSGGDVDYPDEEGRVPLEYAVIRGDIDAIQVYPFRGMA